MLIVLGVLIMVLVPLLLPTILWPYDGFQTCRGDLVTSGPACSFSWAKFLGVVVPGVVVGVALIIVGIRQRK